MSMFLGYGRKPENSVEWGEWSLAIHLLTAKLYKINSVTLDVVNVNINETHTNLGSTSKIPPDSNLSLGLNLGP